MVSCQSAGWRQNRYLGENDKMSLKLQVKDFSVKLTKITYVYKLQGNVHVF